MIVIFVLILSKSDTIAKKMCFFYSMYTCVVSFLLIKMAKIMCFFSGKSLTNHLMCSKRVVLQGGA